ncbi:enoyl-CoA hydratase [Thalassotalea euphylliae]|uniref:Enoyl-CoA hydratase n=1 Tax=Thalassotalea euphylliae TaxID=1655234 RepID=A0A3E0TLS5_9GAMM|nr:enoyl-CoA hydratase [Thalassotalea euphylliae]REL25501.1 enoyl-CoA hydratase [Thalassotalea euphylliae]
MDNLILSNISNGVLTITLNNLEKKNSLTTAIYNSLTQLFSEANSNDDIRCLLLQGNNECFSAGNDLADFLACPDGEEPAAYNFVRALADFTKPIVVAVAGPAIGIGSTLLLHSDIVIATDNAKFGMPFSKLGLCPEAGSSLLLTQLVGHAKAFELMVLGDIFDADTALSLNLINKKVAKDELLPTALAYAERIASLPADAVMSSRLLMKQANANLLEDALQHEFPTFARLMQTDDCRAILNKFLTK